MEGDVQRPDERSHPVEQRPHAQYDSMQGCLLRLFWTAAGNMVLVALLLAISRHQGFSGFDAGYWIVVAALAGARYREITRFAGTTIQGAPATVTDFRRYATVLALVALGLWAGAHLVQRAV
jgi:hypothetical protein